MRINKVAIAIAVALIVITGGAVAYNIANNSQNKILPSSSNNSKITTSELATITACDILTDDIAKSFLGDNLIHQDPSLGISTSPDLSVSNCNYTTTPVVTAQSTTTPKVNGINVLVRVAITQTGADSNKSQFTGLESGQQEVKNIGDKAFYAAQFRQLNVLKNNNWYILTYYKDAITNANLDTDKQLAEKLHYK